MRAGQLGANERATIRVMVHKSAHWSYELTTSSKASYRNKLPELKRLAMIVYAVAQLRFTDRDSYNRYQSRFMEILVGILVVC